MFSIKLTDISISSDYAVKLDFQADCKISERKGLLKRTLARVKLLYLSWRVAQSHFFDVSDNNIFKMSSKNSKFLSEVFHSFHFMVYLSCSTGFFLDKHYCFHKHSFLSVSGLTALTLAFTWFLHFLILHLLDFLYKYKWINDWLSDLINLFKLFFKPNSKWCEKHHIKEIHSSEPNPEYNWGYHLLVLL